MGPRQVIRHPVIYWDRYEIVWGRLILPKNPGDTSQNAPASRWSKAILEEIAEIVTIQGRFRKNQWIKKVPAPGGLFGSEGGGR